MSVETPDLSRPDTSQRLRKHSRLLRVASLATTLPADQLAEHLNVSTRTVQRDIAEIRDSLTPQQELKAMFQGLLLKHVPLEHRVERLGSLIDQNEQPMVALKALELTLHANEVMGSEQSGAGEQSQPLFALPAGSRVAIAIGPGVQESVQVAGRITDNKGS